MWASFGDLLASVVGPGRSDEVARAEALVDACCAESLEEPDQAANQALSQALTASEDAAFHDAVAARLRDVLSAPADTPAPLLAFTALSTAMWHTGPLFHASVHRSGLLTDIVTAVQAGGWRPALTAAATTGVAAWATRVRGIPEYRAAAATLAAWEASVARAKGGGVKPAVSRFAPAVANGGVVDEATLAALAKAEASTRAHLAEHFERGVDFMAERKGERKMLRKTKEEYMSAPVPGQYAAPVAVYGPGAREATNPERVAAAQQSREKPASGEVTDVSDAAPTEAEALALIAAVTAVAAQDALSSGAVLRPKGAATAAQPAATRQPPPPVALPVSSLAARLTAAASATRAPAAPQAVSPRAISPLSVRRSSTPPPELAAQLPMATLRSDLFVVRERAADLAAAMDAAAKQPGTDVPPELAALATRCRVALPRVQALASELETGSELAGPASDAALLLIDVLARFDGAYGALLPPPPPPPPLAADPAPPPPPPTVAAEPHGQPASLAVALASMVCCTVPDVPSDSPLQLPSLESLPPPPPRGAGALSPTVPPVPAPPSTSSMGGILLAAAAGGHVHAVQRCLSAGGVAALEARTRKGESALELARAGGHSAVVELLLAAGASE